MLEFTSPTYHLAFLPDRPFVRVHTQGDQPIAELFAPSSVNSTIAKDDCTWLGEWTQVSVGDDCTCFERVIGSSVWDHKIIRFQCFPHRFSYEIEVSGSADIQEILYFGGYCSAIPRWGSGFFPSAQHFIQGFNPEPNVEEEIYFTPAESSKIDITGVPLAGRGDWFFTPPPFCFAFQYRSVHDSGQTWISMGVEAAAGQNQFEAFQYNGTRGAFWLSLPYEGHLSVTGAKQLPAIGFDFADDPYQALQAHVDSLTRQNCLIPPSAEKPHWWRSPIFCGWGAQCHLASQQKGRAPDFACQPHYESFLSALEAHELNPGIVVIDDKWQAAYGTNHADPEKWPDLPGFIAGQHQKGRKVLLWLKAWDAEGLPPEECIRNAAGLPIAFDPTNPSFRQRLIESIEHMLSPQGYNADGFKLDFTARIPSGPGLTQYGNVWGLELMREYLSLLHTTAHTVKSDALLIAHTPHPYLADVIDMVRLNDINTAQPILPAMRHRARIAKIACPQALIDTDNWPMPNKAAWREYTAIQPELGIPALYFATHIDSTGEAMTAEDYDLIRSVWEKTRTNES